MNSAAVSVLVAKHPPLKSAKAKLEAMEKAIVNRMEDESTALYATARLWDDGLIDPRDTRKVLGFCLSICREAAWRPLKPVTFGVGRM